MTVSVVRAAKRGKKSLNGVTVNANYTTLHKIFQKSAVYFS